MPFLLEGSKISVTKWGAPPLPLADLLKVATFMALYLEGDNFSKIKPVFWILSFSNKFQAR